MLRKNKELVRELSLPAQDSNELHFPTRFTQNDWEQFKACLWKQHLTNWRSPDYNLMRLAFVTISSLLLGEVLWQKGRKIDDEQDLLNILASLYILMQTIGGSNCSSVIPFIAIERTIVYRERFAGMYSSWAYAFAQVIIEIPYVFLQAVLFSTITYPAIGFHCSLYKAFCYFYTMFCTLLFFSYFGMLLVSLTPTNQVASVFANFSCTLFNLFSGYLVPGPKVPKWWIWCYWICPTAWSLKTILTSQYGDITEEITVHGKPRAINAFLQCYYGYQHDNLLTTAVVLLAFPLITAIAFAYAVAKLHFQKR